MRGVVLCLPVALLACGKKEPAASPTAASAPAVVAADNGKAADALWAFAPLGFTDAVVVTPRGLASLEAAVVALQHHVETQPALAQLAAPITSKLHAALGGPFVSLDALGIDRTHGFALWVTHSGFVAVLPIGDRTKLATLVPAVGTDPTKLGPLPCKSQSGAYICASDETMFAMLGKGHRPSQLDEVGIRGVIEGSTTVPWGRISGAVELGNGAFTLHAKMDVPTVLADKGGPPIAVANKEGSGFAVASLPRLSMFFPDLATNYGVTIHQLLDSIGPRFDVLAHPGSLTPDLHLPLVDPAPIATMLSHCKDVVPPYLLAQKQTPGACSIATPDWNMTMDVWIEGNELRAGVKEARPVPAKIARTPLGDEIANGTWTLAAWGRGTTMGSGLGSPKVTPGSVMDAISLLSEIGIAMRIEHGSLVLVFGVRSLYANPPAVLDKLFALTADKATDPATSNAIAASVPAAPFATDLAAGQGGLMVPTAVVGFVMSLAVPAVMDSMKKSHKTPTAVDLDRFAALAKAHYLATGSFPKGKAGPVPAASCCTFASKKCETKLADWTGPFNELGFDVDKPTLYQMSYEGDGQSFTARAIMDLDCDGIEVGWTVTGRVANGTPIIEVTEPPQGVD
ncbi:MAG TPA: hypothetical protein VGM39_14805 [Kofleriaceae bacterium]|jgi:hypothetical protein